MTSPNALDYIYDLQRIGIKFGLTNTRRLLHALGNPHLKFKVIHIAGTNGKGSTAAMITSILKAAGYRVGLYTSPHLIHLSERIQVNGYPISEEDLAEGAEESRRMIQDLNFSDSYPTYFETVTCLALSYFSRQRVDWAVIEVGMGGRFDATNVCLPQVTVITNISLEHQEYLGHTIKEITWEKAGIIKSGCPVVTAVTQEDALDVIKEKCKSVGAPLYLISELYTCEETCRPRKSIPKPFVFKEEAIVHPIKIRRMGIHCLTVTPPLLGHFQTQNTLIVLEVIQRLRDMGLRITDKAVKNGLSQTIWPGRMQVISRKPYLVLDGAHNPFAAEKLAEAIRTHFDYENLILVLGILKDKDVIGICRAIVPLARHILLSAPQSDRSASGEMLYQMIQSNNLAEGSQMVIVPNLAHAISQAKALASEKDLILATGSLYTIGEVMMHLGVNPFQKKVEKAVPNMT